MLLRRSIITDAGFACLVERLGTVDEERFVAMIQGDSFDYTILRRKYFDKKDSEPFSQWKGNKNIRFDFLYVVMGLSH